jgi:hypothetical protein
MAVDDARQLCPYSRMPRTVGVLAVVCFGLLTGGCGSRGPSVQFVEGVVMLDGGALAGADVGFSPASPQGGLSAVGGTRDDGSFTLNAVGAVPGRGTAVGEYVVTVRKFTSKAAEVSVSEQELRSLPPPRLLQPGEEDPPVSLVPEVYGSHQTSPLKATVIQGKNFFRFDLRSDVK